MKNTELPGQLKTKMPNGIFLIASAVLFATVCTASIFLAFQNRGLDNSIEARRSESAEYSRSIENLSNNQKTVAAELVRLNKAEIESTIAFSEAQKYIAELERISKDSGIIFSGFAYANGKVSTSATSRAETVLAWDDGVKKISRLIKTYRESYTGSLFGLSPVLSVSGDEQKRSFEVEFSVAWANIR